MTIEQLLDDLIAKEGGYVNLAADKGGPTKYGITEQRARAEGYPGDMRDLSLDMAKNIYRRIYWERTGFSKVAMKMPALAAELFDCGVNMGPKRASVFLQRALNVLNRGGVDYPDISADGDIGSMTLQALDGLARKRPNAQVLLRTAVVGLRIAAYIGIAEANPSQEVFEAGWLSRVAIQ